MKAACEPSQWLIIATEKIAKTLQTLQPFEIPY